MKIVSARVRDEDAPEGARILVDRLWPRGVSKERARIDYWAKSLTPSTKLRRWFHADRDARYDEFAARYRAELDDADTSEDLSAIRKLAADTQIVLLTDAKQPAESHVPVLTEWLRVQLDTEHRLGDEEIHNQA